MLIGGECEKQPFNMSLALHSARTTGKGGSRVNDPSFASGKLHTLQLHTCCDEAEQDRPEMVFELWKKLLDFNKCVNLYGKNQTSIETRLHDDS